MLLTIWRKALIYDLTVYLFKVSLTIFMSFLPVIAFIVIAALVQKASFKNYYKVIGYKGVVATGIIGTTLHELAHYIMCLVGRHKVEKVCFYKPSSDGTLGYVSYRYDSTSIYQNLMLFAVGYAPFYFGVIYLWFSAYLLLDFNVFGGAGLNENELSILSVLDWYYRDTLQIVEIIIESGWNGVLWLAAASSVILHMMPSKADVKGAWPGFWLLYLGVVVYFAFAHDIGFEAGLVKDSVFDLSMSLSLFLFQVLSLSILIYVFSVVLVLFKAVVSRMK